VLTWFLVNANTCSVAIMIFLVVMVKRQKDDSRERRISAQGVWKQFYSWEFTVSYGGNADSSHISMSSEFENDTYSISISIALGFTFGTDSTAGSLLIKFMPFSRHVD
jgi:hypothetical protein